MESALKQMKLIWAAMLAASVVYVFIPEIVRASQRPVSATIFGVCALLAIGCLAGAVIMRRRFIEQAEGVLRMTPGDEQAMKKWRAGQIVSFAFAEAVVLYGLVLRFAGATPLQVVPWYVAGIAALVVFKPKEAA